MAALLTNYIVKKKAISEDDYEIYQYGFQIGMEMLICMAVCYLIAIRMNMVGQCTLLFFLFFSLRSFVGGLHMDSFKACFLCSCVVVFITLFAVKYCPVSPGPALTASVCEVIVLLFLKPVENGNRPVDEAEKKVFSRKIRQVLTIILFLIILFRSIRLFSYLITIAYTLAVIMISMFLGKWQNRMRKKDEVS